MRIGYARVSTDDQNTQLQIDALKQAGCERIFTDHITGKHKERPELTRLMDSIREGDIIVVWRLDRLGRSLKDLIELLEYFREHKSKFISLTENIDTTSAMGELIFHVIGAMAQFERALISERTKAGLKAARARGRKGGRREKLKHSDKKKAQAMLLDPSVTKTEVAEHFRVSRPTLNKALNSIESTKEQCLFQ
ncbi:MAG: recombinase family protein [gamma proteobacterium symbiont of Bathyaustriella thionipta]|nr:recombinase family protein [gamma proteobacterium symbiont of Bathyaustriella thionipta]MCU7951145.1 recombinase family protein [gamma proteobacterium symbiont of Bathyaustriella thionipta]MCU7954419.1 recombinase family protein [gamma proteobacterium symbiont of Bathyaustriella thionipta]MCU7957658.1 recombinase family protein [gamma proteobacterium symbiont of Bathyaustriella thionipta]MCU7966672.1 recombinase family protein [gamma proteobacterium symbiont of Bathyaustriella thionipta]